ncbi:biliverdin-producing heme oxygenase [Pseudoalteromonas piscicida]|uniref:biliverdin-producing heme oxygenase n=1 Tax=Pseudoalteromonas piscicida TaxID=43662 RepID=UPI0027E4E8BC|nr:biliverdin-producing heme oxygenase [Pseudoalteromonas piscicida]WMO15725.1 biliverdin-producing heme oxygenase [Pseudoalteromonas piscicida]
MTAASALTSRALKLKASTADLHDSIDSSIMAKDPFASIERYLQFLTLQYLFLNDVAALYEHRELSMHIDDLKSRRRLGLLEQDFADLRHTLPVPSLSPFITTSTDFATALGALYVVEGSKVGAAMLGRQVQERLPVTGEYGARYLAGPGAGRGSAWRHLIQFIDMVELTSTQEDALIIGARQAFMRFQQYQAEVYA